MDQIETIKTQAQRYYAQPLLKNLQADLLQSAGAEDRARLRSCAGPKASAWLNCIPKLALFKLAPTDFRISLRLRLGLPQLCIRTDVKCRCGTTPDPLGVHYLTCSTGNHLQTRHDLIVTSLHEMVKASGKHSSKDGLEDVLPGFSNSKGNRLVLDQLITDWTTDREDVGIDVAVCHPCASSESYVGIAKNTDLGAADKWCGFKDNKHKHPCCRHDIVFKPAVLEVFGAMSEQTVGLIKRAASLLEDELPADQASGNLDR